MKQFSYLARPSNPIKYVSPKHIIKSPASTENFCLFILAHPFLLETIFLYVAKENIQGMH